ncbi:hypothetical protein [Humibacter ginsengisoli]|jgi:hypothetical protein
MAASRQSIQWLWRILSVIVLVFVGGIHLFLVFDGVGGLLGTLFVLNSVAAFVLAIAILVFRDRLLQAALALGLLFLIASLLALWLALTVGLFGIREVWTFTLVPETVVVESVGIVILAIATGVALRDSRQAQAAG